MCVVAAKYFPDVGWIGVKNRDRGYKATVEIKQSFRRGIERIYILDTGTKWTEGLNEHGVCILSSSTMVKDDENENLERASDDPDFMSPSGKKVRTALFEKTVKAALKKCIEIKADGNTLIFDKNDCYLT